MFILVALKARKQASQAMLPPVATNGFAVYVKSLGSNAWIVPLGKLFVSATRLVNDLDRARSASEAFLYHRLDSLTETKGLFRLNAKLPIPFDGWSEMEVDLFCSELKLAIEIDGSQHLSNPTAYRSDRQKDALLQERGIYVLRFLAEDLGKHLDATLDAIFRAVAHLKRK